MSTQTLKKLNNYWQARNPRERVLAAAVAAMAVLMLCYSIVQGVRLNLRQLDGRIRTLQDELLNFHHQVARRQTVERQYSRVAAQHSSAWTEPEIQERLRQEIYRLAKKTPPPLNEDGIPTTTASGAGNLVEIPGLGQGTLSTSDDEEYRQYSISIRVPPVEWPAMFSFLERLQNSPQSLRIDALELIRPPDATKIAADIDLTRIIVAGAPAGSTVAAAKEPVLLPLLAKDWTCEGCAVEDAPAEDSSRWIAATATGAEAQLYTSRALPAGVTFELSADITASGPGTLAISGSDGTLFEGAVELHADAKPYRYVVQFTVNGEGGETRLRLPLLRFGGEGARVRVENVRLTELAGD